MFYFHFAEITMATETCTVQQLAGLLVVARAFKSWEAEHLASISFHSEPDPGSGGRLPLEPGDQTNFLFDKAYSQTDAVDLGL